MKIMQNDAIASNSDIILIARRTISFCDSLSNDPGNAHDLEV